MKPKLIIEKNIDELLTLAAEHFFKSISAADHKVNISFSGGNTPKLFFSKIVELYADKILWEKINIWWGDERCVPPHHNDSNFGMTKKYLLDHINIPGDNIFRIYGENDPIKEAARYTQLIAENIPDKNGIPQYDIIYLGLGTDGHTASIFPKQIKLFNADSYSVAARHPESGQGRISITGKIINNAKEIVFIATGESKARIIDEIYNENKSSINYPAALVKPNGNQFYWYLDQAAAVYLK